MQKQFIGQYLIEDGKITRAQLERALAMQANYFGNRHMPLIGTILCEMGAVSETDLNAALQRQEADRRNIPAVSDR